MSMMIASCASTRHAVLNSSRVSARQQACHRTTTTQRKNALTNSPTANPPRPFSSTVDRNLLSTTSYRRSAERRHVSSALASDVAAAAAASSGSDDAKGWKTWQFVASSLLAVAVSGSVVMTSPVSRGSGGGGGGGGGSSKPQSLSPRPSSIVADEEEATAVFPGQTSRKSYDVSVRAVQGARLTMEDEYFVANGGRFAAVFDGHGGGGVSAILRENLYNKVCSHLHQKKKFAEHDELLTSGQYRPSVSSHVAALRSAFEQVEEEVLLDDDLQHQGSTAVAVLVHEGQDGLRTLLVANVGDSRAILSREGRAVDLSRDHKPNEEREKERILAMGETIEWDQYCKVHRVRNLSLSRAIGDRFAKPAVSSEVEIKHFPVVDDRDEFVLLASDGLWDVMTSQDVVSYVHDKLNHLPNAASLNEGDAERIKFARRKNMSSLVAKEALKRGSGDNVCVLIVWLNDLQLKTP